jgi:ubiquinone/menaquinone biosynthesis C-methylase UbiE
MMKLAKRLVPSPVKLRIKNYLGERKKARLFGAFAPLVPRVSDMYDGPQSMEEFKQNGEEFLDIFKTICGLRPDEKILDVGSGIGRKTWPLTQYLNESAVYEGIDVNEAGVEWCRQRYSSRFPNFHFRQIDVYNTAYNPRGKYRSVEYEFPFADQSFSFVMLGSVFTHMLPDDLEHYLSEICRVLMRGGRCLITYFLLNDESLKHIGSGDSTLDLKYVFENYRTISREVPEAAVAFEESWIRGKYTGLGLKIMRLDYGSWCGRQNYLSYQDLVFAVKE